MSLQNASRSPASASFRRIMSAQSRSTSPAPLKSRGCQSKGKPSATKSASVTELSKERLLLEMLRRTEGATLLEMVSATGWQPHLVRGAISDALKKIPGLAIESQTVEGRGRVYRMPALQLQSHGNRSRNR